MKRRLSVLERVMWLGGQVVPINFAIMVRIRGAFSADQLHAALARVRERQPQTAVRVAVDETDGLCFVSEGVPAFPVRILTGCGDADWTGVAGEELGEPFDLDSGPLVRFVLLRGPDFSDLVAVCHHGICDGMSGAYLLRDILSALGEPDAPLPPLPMPPDFWETIPTSARASLRARLQMLGVAALFRVRRLVERVSPKTAVPASGDLPLRKRFCVLGWALGETQTSMLVARCRAEGASVHAAICAAWLRALAEMQAGPKAWVRRASSPINLRDRLTPPAGEAFGLFMSNVITPANCRPERDFWDIAREIKRGLNQGSAGDKVFFWVLALQTMASTLSEAEMLNALADFVRQPVSYDFSITNLGRLDFPLQYGPLHIEAMYGPAVNTCEQERTVGITTIGGRMFFTFAFRDFVLDPAAAEQLRARAMDRLGGAVGW